MPSKWGKYRKIAEFVLNKILSKILTSDPVSKDPQYNAKGVMLQLYCCINLLLKWVWVPKILNWNLLTPPKFNFIENFYEIRN